MGFAFRYKQVTYIDPDTDGWGQQGTVLFGELEEGVLQAGTEVDVPVASGTWRRKIAILAHADLRKMGKPDEYFNEATAGNEPRQFLVYFGSQPPNRDIVCPEVLMGEVPNHDVALDGPA